MPAKYQINPNFRLNTPHLGLRWRLLSRQEIEAQAANEQSGARIFKFRKRMQIIVIHKGSHTNTLIDILYHPDTDFDARGIQKWLREIFRDTIHELANRVLPERVKHWETATDMHGNGVKVERLKRNILACCSQSNVISLQPFLVLFKQEWTDEIILHEIAHYRFKNHRKEFWKFLSTLLGHDARKAKTRKDIEMSPYYEYCLYLTKP